MEPKTATGDGRGLQGGKRSVASSDGVPIEVKEIGEAEDAATRQNTTASRRRGLSTKVL